MDFKNNILWAGTSLLLTLVFGACGEVRELGASDQTFGASAKSSSAPVVGDHQQVNAGTLSELVAKYNDLIAKNKPSGSTPLTETEVKTVVEDNLEHVSEYARAEFKTVLENGNLAPSVILGYDSDPAKTFQNEPMFRSYVGINHANDRGPIIEGKPGIGPLDWLTIQEIQ